MISYKSNLEIMLAFATQNPFSFIDNIELLLEQF